MTHTPTPIAPPDPRAHGDASPEASARERRADGVRRLIILGSTGSIGTQTLDVVRHLNALHRRGEWHERIEVVGLAAGRSADVAMAQAAEFGVRDVALANGDAAGGGPGGVRVHRGGDAAERLVREVEADIVLAAVVGSAGLPATLAAVELGRDVALANKETLVAAGTLVVPAARRTGACLLPVDSEHSAIWQCLQGAGDGPDRATCPPCEPPAAVSRVILTASGGPFRTRSREETYSATPEEALKHPTWNMGPKVTIDCASLTNKALEVVEAHWLFGLPGSMIGVLVHPQSIVHSIVEYADGSAIAQLGSADMRSPIQYALSFPQRPDGVSRKLDWGAMSKLEFFPPDLERFPALGLAYRVIETGGTSGAVFNGANEGAVEAFIAKKIPFGRIPELTREAMDAIGSSAVRDLADVVRADGEAREFVRKVVGQAGGTQR